MHHGTQNSSPVRTRLLLTILLGLSMSVLAIGSRLVAEGGKPVTTGQVRALQSKFQEERAAVEKAASKTKFSPEIFKQVDLLAKKGIHFLQIVKDPMPEPALASAPSMP